MSVKIVDVAKFAEVSPGTVSKVLNNKGYVSDTTREKVLNAVAELGYKHKGNKNNEVKEYRKVCILFNSRMAKVVSNPLYGEVIHGVEESLSEFNYQIIFKSLNGNFKQDTTIINQLISDPMLNGILYTGYNPDDQELIVYLKNLNVPIVLIDNDKWDQNLDCIINDNYKGSLKMVNKLIEFGHTDIAFISGPLTHLSLKKRYEGYKKALETAGIKVKKPFIKIILDDNFYFNDGAEAITELLKKENNKPTAIFAANDELAIGAMNQLIKLGYNVPDDISIAGFDGIEMGMHVIPTLSSVHINKREMGIMAGMRLYQLMNNVMTEPVKIIISVKVKINDSVKNINNR